MADDLMKFADDILDAIRLFPKETEKFVKKEGRKLRKIMQNKAKSKIRKKTGNYLKGFKVGRKVYKWGDAEYNLRVYNGSPHAHLLEYGHRKVTPRGKNIGFTKGYHIVEEAGKEFEQTYADDINNDLVDYILKEIGK